MLLELQNEVIKLDCVFEFSKATFYFFFAAPSTRQMLLRQKRPLHLRRRALALRHANLGLWRGESVSSALLKKSSLGQASRWWRWKEWSVSALMKRGLDSEPVRPSMSSSTFAESYATTGGQTGKCGDVNKDKFGNSPNFKMLKYTVKLTNRCQAFIDSEDYSTFCIRFL